MTDKQINRWLRRRFSPIGWLLLAYYGLMSLMTAIAAAADVAEQQLWSFALGDFSGYIDYDAVYSNGWGYVAAIFVGFAVLSAWKGRDYWRREILVSGASMDLRTFGCFAIFCMGAQMVNTLWISLLETMMNLFGSSLIPLLEQVSGSSDTFSMFLYASLLAPLWEELIFRGCILRALRPYGKRFAILGSAVLFGLFHGNLLQAPYAVLVGLVLGYVTVEYSIGWAAALHMFNNLVLADLLTRLTAGWTDMAYGLLNVLLFGTGALLSGILLFRCREEIRAWRKGEWMDRRCLRCFFFSGGILTMTVLSVLSMLAMFAP